MNDWLRRIRGAVGMGLTWAVGWGLVGGLIELILNLVPGPDLGHIVDMWPQTLGMIGFVGGVTFSVVLRIAAGRRRFDELSLPGFTALGAVGGLLLGTAAIAMGVGGAEPLWLRGAVLLVPPTLLSAASAAGTLALARMAERPSLEAGADGSNVELPPPEE